MLFSEEKNESPPAFPPLPTLRPWPPSFRKAQDTKVLCFFSSEKKTLPSLSLF
jgi:hypothetical protein